jgi:hypothetical protein
LAHTNTKKIPVRYLTTEILQAPTTNNLVQYRHSSKMSKGFHSALGPSNDVYCGSNTSVQAVVCYIDSYVVRHGQERIPYHIKNMLLVLGIQIKFEPYCRIQSKFPDPTILRFKTTFLKKSFLTSTFSVLKLFSYGNHEKNFRTFCHHLLRQSFLNFFLAPLIYIV